MEEKLSVVFYCSTIESVLTYCITAWYANISGADRIKLQRVVKTAHHQPSTLARRHCQQAVS